MDINNINAIIPVTNSIKPVQNIEDKGLKRYEHNSSPRDGIVYVGYQTHYKNTTYSPPGKETKSIVETGEILDIYV